MGFRDIFKHWKGEELPEELPLDRDKDGNALYESDIVAFVVEELEKRRTERKPLEMQWILNSNFLNGNQYCEINPNSNMVEEYCPHDDYSEHEVFNRIAPLMETRLANLKVVDYDMSVLPRTNELSDYEKAKISTEILRYKQSVSNFNKHKDTMLQWAELCGTAFFLTWWDTNKGEVVSEITVSDGVEERTKQLHEGDVDYGLLTAFEVYPESIFKQDVCDQRSIIVEQVLTEEDVYDLYGKIVEGTTADTFTLAPVSAIGGHGYPSTTMSISTRSIDDGVYMRTYFERKSRRYPEGRCIIVANDKLIYYGKLLTDDIPIVAVRSKTVAGRFFGKSPIEDLIPLQRTYNGLKNKIHDYAKTVSTYKPMFEEGSVDLEDWENGGSAPGIPIEYKKGYNPPTNLEAPTLPSSLFSELEQISRDMEYVAGVSQLMVVGSTPTGVTSGTAMDTLRQIDTTRLSPTSENARDSVIELAKLWLKLYKDNVSGYRVLHICGGNESGAVLTWCSEDINSYDIKYTAENALLNSPEQRKASLLQALQLGLLNDEDGGVSRDMRQKILDSMDINFAAGTSSIDELQTQFAQRENSYFKGGVIPEISDFDDHEIHKNEHMRYMLQNEYRLMAQKKPEMCEQFAQHIKQHESAIQQEQAMKIAEQGGMTNG